ncbi:hypothetical protein [Sphingomonas sp.]|uniref:hypothetical protein n=1 Tax=Sphingomonas sp. TaxID=28214 RepID=UPI003B3B20A1
MNILNASLHTSALGMCAFLLAPLPTQAAADVSHTRSIRQEQRQQARLECQGLSNKSTILSLPGWGAGRVAPGPIVKDSPREQCIHARLAQLRTGAARYSTLD